MSTSRVSSACLFLKPYSVSANRRHLSTPCFCNKKYILMILHVMRNFKEGGKEYFNLIK